MNGYDILSPVYEILKRVVFGNKLYKLESLYISKILKAKRVLILGGGNGHLLLEFSKYDFRGKIYYVDSSTEMINRAKKRCTELSVEYINQKESEFLVKDFDAVITPFFLDQFPEKELKSILKRIEGRLLSDGKLIVTDFEKVNGKVPGIVKFMYLFFRVFAGIKGRNLIVFGMVREMDNFEVEQYERRGILSTMMLGKK